MEQSSQWRSWAFPDWNVRLVNYCLGTADSQHDGSVERIPATPEELVQIVGDPTAKAEEVADKFADLVKAELPPGRRSFCGYCSKRRGWTPDSLEPPPFFALLWFTCLVSYGYPEPKSGFWNRMDKIFGRRQSMECLQQAWFDVALWAEGRFRHGDYTVKIRKLELPPDERYRNQIGPSWYLAFPHQLDRKRLGELLVENDLVGEEPPISPVVAILKANEHRFGDSFKEDLNHFLEDFLHRGVEAKDSAFWRALRQEALAGGALACSGLPLENARLHASDYDGLNLYIASSDPAQIPGEYIAHEIENTADGTSYAVCLDSPSAEGAMGAVQAVFNGKLGPSQARIHFKRGVLVFQEIMTGEYVLVGGAAVQGADMAIVRSDLEKAFLLAFGGDSCPSVIPDWREIRGCRLVVHDTAPAGLSGVPHLLSSMLPPSVRLVGGIRSAGGFHATEEFLPKVRFASAEEVEITIVGTDFKEFAARSTRNEDEWDIPGEVCRFAPCELTIRVLWKSSLGRIRVSEGKCALVSRQLSTAYKPLPSGSYWSESCLPGETIVPGGSSPRFGITCDASGFDFIELEDDVRYLGPGVGEISQTRRDGFDWLAQGPLNSPRLLMFIGNPSSPIERTKGYCVDPGSRRHWRRAFRSTRNICVRLGDGKYEDLTQFPEVRRVLQDYRNPQIPRETERREFFGKPLESRPAKERPPTTEVREEVWGLVDAIAALSVRTKGIKYAYFLDLFARVIGLDPWSHSLRNILRGWVEGGFFDLVGAQGNPGRYIIARRPRLVARQVGPSVTALMMGCMPRAILELVPRFATKAGISCRNVCPANSWTPPVLRLDGELPKLKELVREFNLDETEWLNWPIFANGMDGAIAPAGQGLPCGEPHASYRKDRVWDWARQRFVKTDEDLVERDGIALERLRHQRRCPIYLVRSDGYPVLWTNIENWAQLLAQSLSPDGVVFRREGAGLISRDGEIPVFLPLPVGRLAAVFSEALPGPVLAEAGATVQSYEYRLPPPIASGIERALRFMTHPSSVK